MKTKFTTIALMFLSLATLAGSAEQKVSKTGRLFFKNAEKARQELSGNPDRFKHLSIAGDQFSVPQFSEDYVWDSNHWKHVSNTNYTYDGAGRITEEIVTDQETIGYTVRNFYSYDEFGNTVEENSYTWELDRWVPINGERLIYSHSNGYLERIIEQKIVNGVWVNQTKTEYSYDYLTVPAGVQTYQWDGNEWQLYSRYIHIKWADWNARKMANYTLQNWKENNWGNERRVTTHFNGKNYTATTELWENEEWANSIKETYSRTETIEELIFEIWTAGEWEKVEKFESTYYNNGNLAGVKYNTWSETHWEVEMAFFFDLTYNLTNDVTEMIIRYWDPALPSIQNVSKYVFSDFLRFTTDVPEVGNLHNVNVFPNPVSSNFTIQIDDNKITNYQVNIVNLAGQTVFSNSYSDSSISVNIEGFTPGMYLLNVKSDEGQIYTSKLLKK